MLRSIPRVIISVMWVVIHQIFESAVGDAYPVVEHRFFGRTRAEAEGVYRAHRQSDAFLRGCDDSGRYGQIRCRTQVSVQRIA